MKEWNGHVTEEWLRAFQDGKLSAEEERRLLTHVGRCDYCAERLAQTMEKDLCEPPAYLQEEILERSRCADVQAARKVYQTSRQMRLFLYSLKVGLALATSLFLLFCTSRANPEDFYFHRRLEQVEPHTSITDTLEEESRKMGGYLRQFTDNLWDMNEEELYD